MRILIKRLNLGATLQTTTRCCSYSTFSDLLRSPHIRDNVPATSLNVPATSLTVNAPVNPALSVVPARWRSDNFTGSRRKALKKDAKTRAHLERMLEQKYKVWLVLPICKDMWPISVSPPDYKKCWVCQDRGIISS